MEKIENDKQMDIQDTSFFDIIYEYIRHWKWFILSIALCLALGAVFIMTSEKQYKPSISILLDEDKNKTGRSNNASGLSLDELGLLSTTSNIDNEIAILTSPDLMRSVVDSLNLTTSYYVRERFRNRELYTSAPILAVFSKKKDNFEGQISLTISKNGNNFDILGKYVVNGSQEILIKEHFSQLPATIILPDSLGTISLSLSGSTIQEGENYYIFISNPIIVANRLNTALSVLQTSKSSSALNMSILTNNTSKGAAILRGNLCVSTTFRIYR